MAEPRIEFPSPHHHPLASIAEPHAQPRFRAWALYLSQILFHWLQSQGTDDRTQRCSWVSVGQCSKIEFPEFPPSPSLEPPEQMWVSQCIVRDELDFQAGSGLTWVICADVSPRGLLLSSEKWDLLQPHPLSLSMPGPSARAACLILTFLQMLVMPLVDNAVPLQTLETPLRAHAPGTVITVF